jgi:hypothetical protein
MAETEDKKPAHEVIVSRLEKIFKKLGTEKSFSARLMLLLRSKELFEVLTSTLLSDEHRKWTADNLRTVQQELGVSSECGKIIEDIITRL